MLEDKKWQKFAIQLYFSNKLIKKVLRLPFSFTNQADGLKYYLYSKAVYVQ